MDIFGNTCIHTCIFIYLYCPVFAHVYPFPKDSAELFIQCRRRKDIVFRCLTIGLFIHLFACHPELFLLIQKHTCIPYNNLQLTFLCPCISRSGHIVFGPPACLSVHPSVCLCLSAKLLHWP